jgi:tetratricopeptide (TPR) repeat protein
MSMRPLVLLLLATPAFADPDAVARAQELLRRAGHEREAEARYKLADEARTIAELEIGAHPKNAAAHLELARALAISDPAHPEQCRPPIKETCERAVSELLKTRAIDDKQIEAEHVAFELGIVYSRLGRFKEALAEYDNARRLTPSERDALGFDDEPISRSILYSNSAETLMALGRIPEAIALYRKSRDAARPLLPAADLAWQLAEWGLGVALDRDDQIEASRASIASALEHDPNMRHLQDDDVFFEPAGEQFYYLALGHEVAGDRDEAIESWQKYLASPDVRYSRRARAHLEALKKGAGAGLDRLRVTAVIGDMWGPGRRRDQVDAVLRDRLIDARRCYARALREHPALKGQIALAVELIPAGVVRAALVAESTVGDEGLVRCLKQSVETWRFGQGDEVASRPGVSASLLLRFAFDGAR